MLADRDGADFPNVDPRNRTRFDNADGCESRSLNGYYAVSFLYIVHSKLLDYMLMSLLTILYVQLSTEL